MECKLVQQNRTELLEEGCCLYQSRSCWFFWSADCQSCWLYQSRSCWFFWWSDYQSCWLNQSRLCWFFWSALGSNIRWGSEINKLRDEKVTRGSWRKFNCRQNFNPGQTSILQNCDWCGLMLITITIFLNFPLFSFAAALARSEVRWCTQCISPPACTVLLMLYLIAYPDYPRIIHLVHFYLSFLPS